MQNRENALKNWLDSLIKENYQLESLTGDASFRRYYRLSYQNQCRIAMDAPPEKETLEPFIDIAARIRNQGLTAPMIYAKDSELGFALLDDFGDKLFFQGLKEGKQDTLYKSAIDALVLMQGCNTSGLSAFDDNFIEQELNLFRQWFLKDYLNLNLSAEEEEIIQDSFDWLKMTLAKQPKVFIHRDYHSRNLMLLANDSLGIIDFQDAMIGPFTYDLVSLLKDCYIQWPRQQILEWLSYFYEKSKEAKIYSKAEFIKAFDYCGLQRHFKVLGIFCRLYLRDNKPNYLNDLPLVLNYVLASLEGEKELAPLYQFMQTRVQLP